MLAVTLPEYTAGNQKSEHSPAEAFDAGRLGARLLADNTSEAARTDLARAFGYRLISSWWGAFTSAHDTTDMLREPLRPFATSCLSPSADALARGLGEAAAHLEAEAAAYQIGLTYTDMLPREYRALLGIYYTPPALTARLIAQATEAGVDWTRCRVLDPACGGGAFLAPVARRILKELDGCDPRILVENVAHRLRGFEMDPYAAWLSQVTLDAVLMPVTRKAGQRLPVVVSVRDSLQESSPRDLFDLVIGNPPYGRIRLTSGDRARFKRSLFGHANLYGLFTDIALRHAEPGGVVAFVTPTSFLAGEYFKNLRRLLGQNAPPATIDFVSARKDVFDGVLQETLLATYKRGKAPSPVAVHEFAPSKSAEIAVANAGRFLLPANPSQPWLLPRNAAQAPLVATLAKMKHRLADWGYTVSTGPLVWNRYKDQLANGPGRNRLPLIWAEAVTPDGRFEWRAEKKNHTPYFEIRTGDGWLVTKSPCVLLQRTTAKEQCRRLIAAVMPAEFLDRHGAVVIENHLNMLRPIMDRPPVAADALAAFFNSAAADLAFRCVSGSVAVSAYELEALPLPPPKQLLELVRLVGSTGDRSRIEAECKRLYGGAD